MSVPAKRFATICFSLIIVLLVWRYYNHVWQLTQQRLTEAEGFADHNFSDLYPRWLGAREALIHGRDPYSDEVTREIQRGYYGRPITPGRPGDPVDEQRFAYPFYVVFLVAPFVGLPFSTVKVIFTALLAVCALWTVSSWTQTAHPRARPYQIILSILAALATLPYIEALRLQQMSLLVAFFIVATIIALRRKRFVVAGVLLACTTIKPQLSVLFVGCILFWSICQWKERQTVVFSFLIGMSALVGASLLILPNWPREFVAGLGPYVRYTHATTGLRLLLGRVGEIVILTPLILIVGFAVVRTKSAKAESAEFNLAITLVLALTSVVAPSLAPHNQVLLTPAYIHLAHRRTLIWERGRLARSLWVAAWLALGWPTATATVFGAALVSGNAQWAGPWPVVLATNPLIPVVALCALITLVGIARKDPIVE